MREFRGSFQRSTPKQGIGKLIFPFQLLTADFASKNNFNGIFGKGQSNL